MQLTKFRVLSAITTGSLALAMVATTVSNGTSNTTTHAALAAKTESFPPVNLNDCPVLHTGYPTGGCVAQLQTDLKVIQDPTLVVDGTFGLARLADLQRGHRIPKGAGPSTGRHGRPGHEESPRRRPLGFLGTHPHGAPGNGPRGRTIGPRIDSLCRPDPDVRHSRGGW